MKPAPPQQNPSSFAAFVQASLRHRSVELARQWLDELMRRLPESPRRIFPEQTLLNHIPMLLRRVADLVVTDDSPLDNPFIREELRLLANLRRSQGYAPEELVTEFEILSRILFTAIQAEAEAEAGYAWAATEIVATTHRVAEVLWSFSRETVEVIGEGGTTERKTRSHLLASFTQAANHELRNRLNAALLALELTRRRLDDDPTVVRELIGRCERTLRQIEGVIADVFVVALAQQNTDAVEGRRSSLRALIAAVVDSVRPLAVEHEIQLSVVGSVPEIQVDAARVELVLINLISNATKYHDPSRQDRWIRVDVQRSSANDWCVTVADNGVGIDPDLIDHVFDKRVRGRHEGVDGKGLGLNIAKEAVLQLGGRIWVESISSEGSRFRFTVSEPPASLPVLDVDDFAEEST